MRDLLYRLEDTYLDRCGTNALKLSAWAEAAREFPPHEHGYHTKGLMPSTLFALVAGDMGLAMLWIVQHVLVHSLLGELSAAAPGKTGTGILSSFIKGDLIGALAHSEDPASPVIIIEAADQVSLKGVKKYITGGLQCDFVLLTARGKKEEKISRLVFIPRASIPKDAMEELDLPMLQTTSHARLRTDGISLHPRHIVCADGSLIRRLIKKWGIVERSLILEAYIAFCSYLANRMKNLSISGLPEENSIEGLLKEQKDTSSRQISESEGSPMPAPGGMDSTLLLETAKRIETAAQSARERLPDDLLKRVGDLGLYRLFS